ncbi:MAG: MFS transporter [Promethearchaeota archaeon]
MERGSKARKDTAFARITVFVILFSNFFRSIGLSVIEIGLPRFIISLSGTLISYGLVIGIFSVTQSVFQFPMAALSDKYGKKKIVLMGIFIYTLGTFLCYFSQSILQFIIFRAIQGAGAYTSILMAIVADLYEKEEKGKGMSYFSISFTLGYFGGVMIGGYIAYYLGFRYIFLISGCLATISGLLILIFLKEKHGKTATQNNNTAWGEETSILHVNTNELKHLIRDFQYKMAVLINCIRWFTFSSIVAYLIWLMQIQFGLNEIETSYLLLVLILIYISFVIVTGRLVDILGPRKIMILGQAIIISFGLLFIVVSFTLSFLLFIIAGLFSSLGLGMFETAGNTNLLKKIEHVNPNLKGSGFGLNNSLGFFCGAIGPIVLSFLGTLNLFLPFYFIGVLISITLILTIIFVKSLN